MAGGVSAAEPRPAVIVQDDLFDATSSVIVAPMTNSPASRRARTGFVQLSLMFCRSPLCREVVNVKGRYRRLLVGAGQVRQHLLRIDVPAAW